MKLLIKSLIQDIPVFFKHPVLMLSFYYWLFFTWRGYIKRLNYLTSNDPHLGLYEVRTLRGRTKFHYPPGEATDAIIAVCDNFEARFVAQIRLLEKAQ